MFAAFGLGLPVSGVVFTAGNAVIGVVTGVAVTVAAALAGALRASRTSPLAAMRDAASDTSAASRTRIVGGGVDEPGARQVPAAVLTRAHRQRQAGQSRVHPRRDDGHVRASGQQSADPAQGDPATTHDHHPAALQIQIERVGHGGGAPPPWAGPAGPPGPVRRGSRPGSACPARSRRPGMPGRLIAGGW